MNELIKTYVGWRDIHEKCEELIRGIKLLKWDFSYIVAVGRGGLVPAAIIGSSLDLPIVNMGLKSYIKPTLQEEIIVYQFPDHCDFTTTNEDYHNVLVIDDINDSGETFKHVDEYMQKCYPSTYCHFWSLFRRDTSSFGEPRIDYSNRAVDEIEIPTQGEDLKDNKWVVMPWEHTVYVG